MSAAVRGRSGRGLWINFVMWLTPTAGRSGPKTVLWCGIATIGAGSSTLGWTGFPPMRFCPGCRCESFARTGAAALFGLVLGGDHRRARGV